MTRIYLPSKDDSLEIEVKGKKHKAIKREAFDRYSPAILGLGDVKKEAGSVSALVAVFDLQGFTHFCRQIEPELSVPVFLEPVRK